MIDIFIRYPGYALMIGLIFIIVGRVRRRKWEFVAPAFIAGVAWAIYSAWEYYHSSEDYNIRVDLLLIYPFLFLISMFGVIDLLVKRNIFENDKSVE